MNRKREKNINLLGIGSAIISGGVTAYTLCKLSKERKKQSVINEIIFSNQEIMLDELGYHEEVLEEFDDRFSTIKIARESKVDLCDIEDEEEKE